MLSEEELVSVAEAYARQHYGRAHGDHYKLERLADLAEPAGVHFGAAYPPGHELLGDGGFFVMRCDGVVIPLGSGDFDAPTMFQCLKDSLPMGSDAWNNAVLRPIILRKLRHPSAG